MQYRRFGRTELQMPVLSCGGMRYQHGWKDMPMGEIPDEAQRNLENTIRRAVESGINHIETARGYGSSERQLGLILPTYPREELIVQTKVAPQADPDAFVRDFEDSLARLQLDYVDLLGIHGVNDGETLEWAIRPGGCLAQARKLQQRGLVRHVGFSTHGSTEDIMAAIQHKGDGGFDYVNLHWYYIFQKHWPCIEEATRRDMGVFIISPSDKGGKLYEPPDKLVDLCKPLHPMVFNDLFCLSHPQVHTLSIGAARPSDFDEHLEAVALLDQAEELLPPILQRLQAAWDQAIEPALRRPFDLGLPEWDQTPGEVNVPIILWLRNLVRAWDLHEYGKMRYNLLGNGGHWFPGENAGKLDELDLSPIAAQAGLDGELIEALREAHAMLGGEEVKRLSESEA